MVSNRAGSSDSKRRTSPSLVLKKSETTKPGLAPDKKVRDAPNCLVLQEGSKDALRKCVREIADQSCLKNSLPDDMEKKLQELINSVSPNIPNIKKQDITDQICDRFMTDIENLRLENINKTNTLFVVGLINIMIEFAEALGLKRKDVLTELGSK